jgi:hypothetical protein
MINQEGFNTGHVARIREKNAYKIWNREYQGKTAREKWGQKWPL